MFIQLPFNAAINFAFEEPSYTFIEPPSQYTHVLFLNKDHETEQTFLVDFYTQSQTISDRYLPATPGADETGGNISIFLTSEQRLPYAFYLFNNNITDETEVINISAVISEFEVENSLLVAVESEIVIIDSECKYV